MSKRKGKKQVKVTILYGLPGSGKTFFAQKNRAAQVIDFDQIIKDAHNKFSVLAELIQQVKRSITYRTNQVIIDGLVTTNQQLREMMDALLIGITEYQLVFELVYWNEDRESCLYNDKGRREVSSGVSIRNLPYEKPSLAQFPELSQKRVQAMKVVRKSPAISWIISHLRKLEYTEWKIEQILSSMQLRSESWSLGGTWGSWDGSSGEVESETPLEFTELDALLEQVCPSISFLNYKKLQKQCCKLESKHESDYYGGGTRNAWHVCDVQALYDFLLEMNLIKEDQ